MKVIRIYKKKFRPARGWCLPPEHDIDIWKADRIWDMAEQMIEDEKPPTEQKAIKEHAQSKQKQKEMIKKNVKRIVRFIE